MTDFVVSGAGGFIGGHLRDAFAAAGARCESYHEFRDGTGHADTFVHCAFSGESVTDNAALTADVLATIGPRIKRFVQLQTFATLHGAGRIDRTRFNLGLSPRLMGPYGHAKMMQERVACAAHAAGGGRQLELIYLPAVLGGGVWERHRDRARQFGVVLPPRIRPDARANWVHVDRLAAHLLTAPSAQRQGVVRTILNDPGSASLTWPEFFAGAQVRHAAGLKSLLRLSLTLASLTRYNLRMRRSSTVLPPGRRDTRPAVSSTGRHEAALTPSRPLAFDGLIQQVVRMQPYIPADAE